MKKLDMEKLDFIKGGATISGTLLKGFVDLIGALFEAGRAIGSAIRRTKEGSVCRLE